MDSDATLSIKTTLQWMNRRNGTKFTAITVKRSGKVE